MVHDTCAEAGTTEKKTNHSGASHMSSASVPEKLIKSRTGHRSLEALILNEKPSDEQQQAILNILTSGAQAQEFGKEVTNITASNVQPITSRLQYRHQSQHATGGGFSTQHATGGGFSTQHATGGGLSTQHATGGGFSTVPTFAGSLFGSMMNWSLTISPQNFVVNINPIPT